MRNAIIPLAAAILGAAALPKMAAAQTQIQQDRLEQLAQYTALAPVCEKLGMTIVDNPADVVQFELRNVADQWNLDREIAEKIYESAVARHKTVLQIDLEMALENARSDEELRNIGRAFMGYGETCASAATDVIYSKILTIPSGYDLAQAVKKVSDDALEDGGLASWQTPSIVARGDIATLAGACRRQIGAKRSDALMKTYASSDDPRARAHYLRSFDDGLSSTELSGLTPTQCERALKSNIETLMK